MRLQLCLALLVATSATSPNALRLRPETKTAWQQFVENTNSRTKQEAQAPDTFLAVDRSLQTRERVRNGEILVRPAERKGMINVPDGLIHDWIGDVFVPNVNAQQVIDNARSFERYPGFYKPSVLSARTLKEDGNNCAFSLLLREKVVFVDAALDGQYRCSYSELPQRRWFSLTDSTRLQEIINYGSDDQHEFQPDTGNGFIWRLHNVVKYEQADGGVYIEVEAAALSRPIPGSIRWMVNGMVERISRSALTTTLRQTRDANLETR